MRKIVYLISPESIEKDFYSKLDKVLSYGNVAFFQLRLKKFTKDKIIKIALKVKKITKKYKVNFLLNDDYKLALKIKADGCHMGQGDGPLNIARYKLKNKILGVTCHNSKKIANNAIIYKPDYLAFGSFYKSKLKPKAKKSNPKILKWAKKSFKNPIVVIGGINNRNYKNLIKYGAKYIAISSYIWDNPKLKPDKAIKVFI